MTRKLGWATSLRISVARSDRTAKNSAINNSKECAADPCWIPSLDS
jgi:hypothetical protein